MPAEFIDTNILVYAYDRTAGIKFDRARALMESLWDRGEGVLSTQVLQEFYVAVTSKIPQPLGYRGKSSCRAFRPGLNIETEALDVPQFLLDLQQQRINIRWG